MNIVDNRTNTDNYTYGHTQKGDVFEYDGKIFMATNDQTSALNLETGELWEIDFNESIVFINDSATLVIED